MPFQGHRITSQDLSHTGCLTTAHLIHPFASRVSSTRWRQSVQRRMASSVILTSSDERHDINTTILSLVKCASVLTFALDYGPDVKKINRRLLVWTWHVCAEGASFVSGAKASHAVVFCSKQFLGVMFQCQWLSCQQKLISIMYLEAVQDPSPNILHGLKFPDFKKIGGFWFCFLLSPTQLYRRNSFSCFQK